MGFPELKDRIISEAKKDAEEIIKDANRKAESILEEANIEAENIKSLGLRNIERDMSMLKRQRLANIKLEMQKGILTEVQNAIEDIINGAIKEILDSPEYFDYLLKSISHIELRGNEEIVLSRYDAERFGDRLLEELKRIRKDITLKISTGNIVGGFIFRGVDFDINSTLELILQNIRLEVEQEIRKILKEAEANVGSV
ncbi:MAG: V-type ATP synthase subunit E [bacterium]